MKVSISLSSSFCYECFLGEGRGTGRGRGKGTAKKNNRKGTGRERRTGNKQMDWFGLLIIYSTGFLCFYKIL